VSPTVRFRCFSIPSAGSAVYFRAPSPRTATSRGAQLSGQKHAEQGERDVRPSWSSARLTSSGGKRAVVTAHNGISAVQGTAWDDRSGATRNKVANLGIARACAG
jgi:hypothetical protein